MRFLSDLTPVFLKQMDSISFVPFCGCSIHGNDFNQWIRYDTSSLHISLDLCVRLSDNKKLTHFVRCSFQ